jgi:hypothetical protein
MLMSHKYGQEFTNDHQFSEAELQALTPNDIYRFIKFRAYGDADGDEDNLNPTGARSNAVKFWKKAISYFMPNNGMVWNEISNVGNPTRATLVNKLIKKIKLKEAARLGKEPQARRALFASEFESAIEVMESLEDKELACFMSGYFRFQYNMIARVDDSAKFRSPDLKIFHQFPDIGVIAKLCWSKNVMDERDAPDQVLLGAFDHRYCVLIGLALWLEYHCMLNPEENEFIFGIGGLTDPKSIKRKASDHLKKTFQSHEFNVVDEGKKGTHSMRKFATTQARGNGCSKDDTDCRARWKGHKRQQDEYADVTIPYVDAKVAAALCKGGACTYMIREGSQITDDWILDYVVPNMRQKFPRQVCIVLGRALLWRIFDESGDNVIPDSIRNRVMAAYGNINEGNNEGNPIMRLAIGVDGVDSQLVIDTLFDDDDDEGNDGGDRHGRRVRRRIDRHENAFLRSQVMHLRREQSELLTQLERRDEIMQHSLQRINRNVQRIANSPFRRQVNGPVTNEDEEENARGNNILQAKLLKTPRTLHELWQEYELGGPGRKPVKDWTAQERGKCKHTIYMRKFLWNKVAEMVRAGIDANLACDQIYGVYGQNNSVTNILKALKRDSKNGGHPNLRIQRQ